MSTPIDHDTLKQHLQNATDIADLHRALPGERSLTQQLEALARQDGVQAVKLWHENASEALQAQPWAMPQALRMLALVESRFEDSRRRELQVAADRDVYVRRAEPGGTYDGPIIGATDKHVLQRVRDSEDVVLHRRRHLDIDPRGHGERDVQIRYPHGQVGLVALKREPGQAGREVDHHKQSFREAGR